MRNVASWIRGTDEEHFLRFSARHGDIRLFNARTEPVNLPTMHGLLLTGGSDISTDFLKQKIDDPSHVEEPDAERDAWEFAALRSALEAGLPVFAVCRGHQVLNVALGGTLHLDIPGHRTPEMKTQNIQPLRYASDARHRFAHVNSSHHQAIDKLGDGLEIEAWCASDDIIEQVRLRDYPFCLGVQYHPERGPVYAPLFEDFFAHVRET